LTYKPEEAPAPVEEQKPSIEDEKPSLDEPKPIIYNAEVASPPLLADTEDLLVSPLENVLFAFSLFSTHVKLFFELTGIEYDEF